MLFLRDNGPHRYKDSVAVGTFAGALIAVLCLALTSCDTATEPTPVELTPATTAAAATFDVSPNSRSVRKASGTARFAVSSSVGWSVEDDVSWLTTTKTDGGTISVSYDANASPSSRTANIKAFGTGGVEETVTVTQAAAAAATFDVSPNSRNVGSTSGTTSFAVSSSVGWSVEDEVLWLSATKTDGGTISVSYDANASGSSRTANISAFGTGGVEETVTVTQAATATFDVSPNSRSVGSTSGTTSFAVSSSVGWSVEDDASWLAATKTDGSTISVSYEANASGSSRTVNITAFGTGGVVEIVTVTQGTSATFDVGPNNINVSSASGTTAFAVSSSVGWSVEDDASWLTATKTDGSTISVSYDANASPGSRIANIKAWGTGGVEETVTVTQGGS